MNSQAPFPESNGSLPRMAAAWNDFWFTPRDPTLLGLIRILVGSITLYTFIVHGLTLDEFMGEHAWFDLSLRKELLAERPTIAQPLDGHDAPPVAPANDLQARFLQLYEQKYNAPSPGPNPTTEGEADFAFRFRDKYRFDFRQYGLPFPQNEAEAASLLRYADTYRTPMPPPYPKDAAEEAEIARYTGRHHIDPRRLYARGIPLFSVWVHVTNPTWMAVVQSLFVGAAVCFVIGLATRITAPIVWFANLCYIHRDFLVLFGVDTMMTILLLYLMIGPSGAALSVDRLIGRWWRRKQSNGLADLPPTPTVSANVAIRLMQIHLCIIYVIAGVSKLLGQSWWNGTAVWNVLANFEFAPMHSPIYMAVLRALGANQTVHELFIGGSTILTIAFEIGYPFLIWRPSTRWLFLAGAIWLHGFIGLFMGLKTFSLMMLTFNMAFLRPEEVQWLLNWRSKQSTENVPAALEPAAPKE